MLTDVNARQLIELPDEITPRPIQEYREQVLRLLALSPGMILLDCSTIRAVTSTHVGLMWEMYVDCRRKSIKLQLVNVSEQVRHILRTLDLDDIFFSPNEESANMEVTVKEFTSDVATRQYKDTIGLSRADIDQSVTRFVTFLEELGVRSIAAFELRLIFYEVLMNVKLHSGLSPKDIVTFETDIDRTGATLRFEDSGRPFNPTEFDDSESAQEAARTGRIRGFGLAMIRKMVSEISYSRENNSINRLKISKVWG